MKNYLIISIALLVSLPNKVYSQPVNTTLSNLTTTAVNRTLTPGSAYSNLDLGTSAYGWKSIYMGHTDSISSFLMYYTNKKFLHTAGGATSGNSEGLFLGEDAGASAGSSNNGCVGIGYTALKSMSIGNHNTCIGWRSGFNLTGIASGQADKNTMIGSRAGQRILKGDQNTGVGYDVFYNKGDNTETQAYINGTGNTGIGGAVLVSGDLYGVLGLLANGNFNTVLGYGSGLRIDDGTSNLFLGDNCGISVSTGSNNIFVGSGTANNITSGDNNIYIGVGLTASAAGASDELNIGNTLFGDLSNNFISIGSSTLTSMFNVGSAAEFQVSSAGKIDKYNNEDTEGNGIAAILKVINLSGQNATISATDLLGAGAVTGGIYRISFEGLVTTAASGGASPASSISIQVVYTDASAGGGVSLPKNYIEDISKTTSNVANASSFTGTFIVNATAATAIRYKINYSSTGTTAMVYAIRVIAEKL